MFIPAWDYVMFLNSDLGFFGCCFGFGDYVIVL